MCRLPTAHARRQRYGWVRVDRFAIFRRLLRDSPCARAEDLPRLMARAIPLLGVARLAIYLVDHQQTVLTRVPAPGSDGDSDGDDVLRVDGTVAGRAFITAATQEMPASDGTAGSTMWIPLCNGSDRLGVLRIDTDTVDKRVRADCELAATLLGDVVYTCSLYGDAIARLRRTSPMRAPAELIRGQLPPATFTTPRLVISGILEPCYDVGGDAFDYAVNGDIAHMVLFDAVGHGAAKDGMRAAVLATIALAAYRNARRDHFDLADTYRHVDTVVRAHDRAGLITGVFVELDQATGNLCVISAGHPGGFIVRDGKVVTVLPTPTALPVSMGDLRAPVIVEETLEPGDRLVLYTDGITEARTADGQFFGADRLIDFIDRAMTDGLPAPETMRRLVQAILAHQDNVLQDDATVLLAHWIGDQA